MEILISLVLMYGLVGGAAVTGVVLYKKPRLAVNIIEKLIIVGAVMLGMRQFITIMPNIINKSYDSVFCKYIYNLFVGDYHLVIGNNAQVTLSQALSDPMFSVFMIPIVGAIISVLLKQVLLFGLGNSNANYKSVD